MRGWLLSDNVHGDVLVRAALGGADCEVTAFWPTGFPLLHGVRLQPVPAFGPALQSLAARCSKRPARPSTGPPSEYVWTPLT